MDAYDRVRQGNLCSVFLLFFNGLHDYNSPQPPRTCMPTGMEPCLKAPLGLRPPSTREEGKRIK